MHVYMAEGGLCVCACASARATFTNDWNSSQVKDPSSGDFYYYNKKSGVTQWDAPAESAEAASKTVSNGPAKVKFDVKEFERTGNLVPLENQGENLK